MFTLCIQVQALQKTYVIDVMEDGQGKVNFNVPAFRRALGSLRLMLKIGMGKEEEQVLKKCLRSVSNPCMYMYLHYGAIHVCLGYLYTYVYMLLQVHYRAVYIIILRLHNVVLIIQVTIPGILVGKY